MQPRRINIRAVIFKEGKLLAQQLAPGADGVNRDYYLFSLARVN